MAIGHIARIKICILYIYLNSCHRRSTGYTINNYLTPISLFMLECLETPSDRQTFGRISADRTAVCLFGSIDFCTKYLLQLNQFTDHNRSRLINLTVNCWISYPNG